MSPQYINSYWATEHGGIVWTHFYGNEDFPLRPDAHTYPLPWIARRGVGAEGGDRDASGVEAVYRIGRLWRKRVKSSLPRAYPYLTRTIWGDVKAYEAWSRRFAAREWRPRSTTGAAMPNAS
jgi:acrylyl-CoA reductase (NADPH)/3-hydroxypropionyl-CoA dehydratase/3-hydroxypropionyl-CoA synthetase